MTINLEAQRNIDSKLGIVALNRFYNQLAMIPFTLAPIPDKAELERFEKTINKKDVHVVAASFAIDADFLLVLDKRLAVEVNGSQLPFQALLPGDFITRILPSHEEFPKMRN